VTICTHRHKNYFGEIEKGRVKLSKIGKTAERCWIEIPQHFPHVYLDEFVMMPNHIHSILIINNVGNKDFCSLQTQNITWQKQWARSLSSVVRGVKIGVTKWCKDNKYEDFHWQKSFYDKIIRDEKSLRLIREYIQNNPLRWDLEKNDIENLDEINF